MVRPMKINYFDQTVKIKRVDKDLPLPKYHTEGSVGFDFTCLEDVSVPPWTPTLIRMNEIVKVPKGFALGISLRSSSAKNKGLFSPLGVGIIDQDYCGDKDMVKALVINYTQIPRTVKRGERIAQGVFFKVARADFEEVDELREGSRGGFGSTGIGVG